MENQFDPGLDKASLITQSIIANQIALEFNENIKREPKWYKPDVKKYMIKLLPVLIKAERLQFDKFDQLAEKETREMCDTVRDSIMEIASLGIHHLPAMKEMAKAYKKSPESMNGITNKINRS